MLRVAAGLARQLIALGLSGIYPGAPHNPKIMSLRMLHIFLNEFSELWAPEASRPRPTSLRGGTPGVLRLDQFDPLPADFWDRRTVYALMGTSAFCVAVERAGYAMRGSTTSIPLPSAPAQLPASIRGTPFEMRRWPALLACRLHSAPGPGSTPSARRSWM